MNSFDFSLSSISFSQAEKLKIQPIEDRINSFCLEIGDLTFFSRLDENKYNTLPLKYLKQLHEMKNLIYDLEEISIKTIKAVEVKVLKESTKIIPTNIKIIQDQIMYLESLLNKEYHHNFKNADSENLKVFGYKEFKEAFNKICSEEIITVSNIENYKKQGFFDVIRSYIIQSKFEKCTTFLVDDGLVSMNYFAKDPDFYAFIRAEAFQQVSKRICQKSPFFGKTMIHEMIRPSDGMASLFNLNIHESAFLCISLDPIPNLDLDPKDQISIFDLMFEVDSPQEFHEESFMVKLKIKEVSINLIVPVYFSFVPCQLINKQRSLKVA